MGGPSFRQAFYGFAFSLMMLSPCVLPSSAGAQAFDKPNDVFKVGPWEGAAQYLDNGVFFSCLMVADYGDGKSAAFGINHDYSFWFGVTSAALQLDSSKTYRISYTIDRFPPVVAMASSPYPNMVMADIADNVAVFQQLRNAQSLTVEVPEAKLTVEVALSNTDIALSALASCVDKNVGNKSAVKKEL